MNDIPLCGHSGLFIQLWDILSIFSCSSLGEKARTQSCTDLFREILNFIFRSVVVGSFLFCVNTKQRNLSHDINFRTWFQGK